MDRHEKTIMQNESVIEALITIRPGQKVVYFVGFLDMERNGNPGSIKAAAMAGQLARKGRIHLTQRRLGLPTKDGVLDWSTGIGPGFEYIATGALKEESWVEQNLKPYDPGYLPK
jgi:hypothetical protein